MTGAGLLLGAVGTDVATGQARFTWGVPELFDGIGFMPVALGMFGLADIIHELASPGHRPQVSASIERMRPQPGESRRADSARHVARFDSRRSAGAAVH